MNAKVKKPIQRIWVRYSRSEYHEIEADTPEEAVEMIHNGEVSVQEVSIVDIKHELEEVCDEPQ